MLTYSLKQLASIFSITHQRMYQLRDAGKGPAQGQDGRVQTEDAIAWGRAQFGRLLRHPDWKHEAEKYGDGLRRLHSDRVEQYAEIARRYEPAPPPPKRRIGSVPVSRRAWTGDKKIAGRRPRPEFAHAMAQAEGPHKMKGASLLPRVK